VPVGLVTGWAVRPESSADAREIVDFVLKKPLEIASLRAALARLAERATMGGA
jgi:hypothetical protein